MKIRLDSSICLKDFLQGFYVDNKEELNQYYPGLKLHLLSDEFKFYSNCQDDSLILAGELLESWNSFQDELERGTPLEYINNRAFFYESSFYVDERVLIPRFETEGLLELALEEIASFSGSSIDICEVGTGPGTISLSLLRAVKDKKINCDAIDISAEALEVASINAFRLQPHYASRHHLNLIEGDRLSSNEKLYDFIYSNPPYIKEVADHALVHPMVNKHEPHIALFLKDEEYNQWFNDFLTQVNDHLKVSGLFLMEGHEAHLEYLGELCENIFKGTVEVIKDLAGSPRILKVRKING
jgi:release factor glutamine methyltransferase